MNKKSTGLDWYYSKSFWKLRIQVTNSKTLKQAICFYLCEKNPWKTRALYNRFHIFNQHVTVMYLMIIVGNGEQLVTT